MQKMICIPEERYEQMVKSYDEAMEALRDLKDQLISDTQIDSLLDNEFRMSETMLKYATDDEITVIRSVCKTIRERSISDDIK